MELVDRHLKALGSYLAAAKKGGIIKGLFENIRSEIETRKRESARPPPEAEPETVLKQHGHPLLVAGRYRQDHRSLAFGRQWDWPCVVPFLYQSPVLQSGDFVCHCFHGLRRVVRRRAVHHVFRRGLRLLPTVNPSIRIRHAHLRHTRQALNQIPRPLGSAKTATTKVSGIP